MTMREDLREHVLGVSEGSSDNVAHLVRVQERDRALCGAAVSQICWSAPDYTSLTLRFWRSLCRQCKAVLGGQDEADSDLLLSLGRRTDPGPKDRTARLEELALRDPFVQAALELERSGCGREEALLAAIEGLVRHNAELTRSNVRLLTNQPPPPMIIKLEPRMEGVVREVERRLAAVEARMVSEEEYDWLDADDKEVHRGCLVMVGTLRSVLEILRDAQGVVRAPTSMFVIPEEFLGKEEGNE